VSKVGPEVERESVAQMAIALMGASARQLVAGDALVRAGQWARRAQLPLGVDFCGATIGLVGIGAIGGTVARILALGYRAQVIASDPYLDAETIAAKHATKVTFEELLGRSDFVSMHCPLTSETARMFSAPQFAAMKSGAIIVNTCRGEQFDQTALIAALAAGKIGGYATDVVEGEPIGADHALLSARNVIVTPHLGGYSAVSLRGMGATMVDDMTRVFVEGRMPGVIANDEIDLATSRIAQMRRDRQSQ
jgi:phosphoglycerate dehydrogenase-like enzyme